MTSSVGETGGGGENGGGTRSHEYESTGIGAETTTATIARHAMLQQDCGGNGVLHHVISDDPYLPLDFPHFDNLEADGSQKHQTLSRKSAFSDSLLTPTCGCCASCPVCGFRKSRIPSWSDAWGTRDGKWRRCLTRTSLLTAFALCLILLLLTGGVVSGLLVYQWVLQSKDKETNESQAVEIQMHGAANSLTNDPEEKPGGELPFVNAYPQEWIHLKDDIVTIFTPDHGPVVMTTTLHDFAEGYSILRDERSDICFVRKLNSSSIPDMWKNKNIKSDIYRPGQTANNLKRSLPSTLHFWKSEPWSSDQMKKLSKPLRKACAGKSAYYLTEKRREHFWEETSDPSSPLSSSSTSSLSCSHHTCLPAYGIRLIPVEATLYWQFHMISIDCVRYDACATSAASASASATDGRTKKHFLKMMKNKNHHQVRVKHHDDDDDEYDDDEYDDDDDVDEETNQKTARRRKRSLFSKSKSSSRSSSGRFSATKIVRN